jgi:hypothetical protein
VRQNSDESVASDRSQVDIMELAKKKVVAKIHAVKVSLAMAGEGPRKIKIQTNKHDPDIAGVTDFKFRPGVDHIQPGVVFMEFQKVAQDRTTNAKTNHELSTHSQTQLQSPSRDIL